MIDIYMGMYYNTIISWSLYYLYVSCQSLLTFSLPWDDCNHAWNSERCQTLEQRGSLGAHFNDSNAFGSSNVTDEQTVSPAEEYFL